MYDIGYKAGDTDGELDLLIAKRSNRRAQARHLIRGRLLVARWSRVRLMPATRQCEPAQTVRAVRRFYSKAT